jgi:5-formyltetrahydrofolate cyclo-ligase
MPNIAQQKDKIRSHYATVRKELSNKAELDKLIGQTLLTLNLFSQGKKLAFYYPTQHEINILPAIKILSLQNIISLPTINKKEIAFRKWNDDEALIPNKDFQIHEPSQDNEEIAPDIIICPLLAFDRNGYRLGYGGGFYDRALKKFPKAIKIGVAYSLSEESSLPTEPHDQKLCMIVTEKEVIEIK